MKKVGSRTWRSEIRCSIEFTLDELEVLVSASSMRVRYFRSKNRSHPELKRTILLRDKLESFRIKTWQDKQLEKAGSYSVEDTLKLPKI